MDAIARGLVLIIAVFLVVSMIVFALINLPAGDPAQTILGNQPWVEEAKALNRGLDDDRPLAVRYFIWLGRAVRRLIPRLWSDHLTS
ncbi:MAG: hypothetical protein ACT4P5_00765 [Armatimonadota bacterium]